MVDGAGKKWKFASVQANRGFHESIWVTTGDRVQTGRKEWSVVEMSKSMDEAEASDEVNMIATNIERLKIKSS